MAAVAAGQVAGVDNDGPIDSLIVCTKAPYTAGAIDSLKHRISSSSVIALLQNGMGVYDELCDKFWPDANDRPQFLLGTTTHGVTPSTPGQVVHVSRPGQGAVKWGIVPDPRGFDVETWLWGREVGGLPTLTPPDSPTSPLPLPPQGKGLDNLYETLEALLSMTALSPSLLPMPHLYHQLLLKLAVNAVVNPLTAVLGGGYLPNGAIHRTGPGHRLINQVTEETSQVLTTYLHALAGGDTPAQPDVVRQFSTEGLLQIIHEVIGSTKANTSSMAMDVKYGRETEVKYINGFLVSLGERLHVPTPASRMLIEMVKFKAEVGGLNGVVYPGVREHIHQAEKQSVEERQLGLEQRRIGLAERDMLLKEVAAREEMRAHRLLKRRAKAAKVEAERLAGRLDPGVLDLSAAEGSGSSESSASASASESSSLEQGVSGQADASSGTSRGSDAEK